MLTVTAGIWYQMRPCLAMLFRRDLNILFEPLRPRIPYGALLHQWVTARFEPVKCQRILESFIKDSHLNAEWVSPEAIARGGQVFSEAVLYPDTGPWELVFFRAHPEAPEQLAFGVTIPLEEEDVLAAAALLRQGFGSRERSAFLEEHGHLGEELLREVLVPEGQLEDVSPPLSREPGIYRRAHASLVVRSGTTSVLVDPLSSHASMPSLLSLPVPSPADTPDALAITHGHGDHWHLPSVLMHAASPEVKVLVPHVPRRSLLTTNVFAHELALVGQAFEAPAWDSTLRVGDIDIEVLPFYGEQPTRNKPGLEPSLRNWGNCYRLDAPNFSLVVLADSGMDPAGSMVDVLRESVRRRGPVDAVVSCLREFDSPFFGGLIMYFASLPFSRLQELYAQHQEGRLPSITAGPEGVAAVCEAASARYFLPYAHGFAGFGKRISDVGWGLSEPSEAELVGRVRSALRERGCPTLALDWNCGDLLRLTRGAASVQPYQG
ncbi:MBL fold metallo-hydrolase [Stigmatella sp. ncwal1]|uniref:MBL fold metallo-hydrolase n=1 Tax=Stigmatella ashevillensis TaxID=2995309 RepID=A0ABT5D5X8_9BACT|nr:MBL fold metallo-hydrolase [Stigmatella ashevillena]MDC0708258.1 MBL fold metallo-hydrolase [Stigmatella ashevillena]